MPKLFTRCGRNSFLLFNWAAFFGIFRLVTGCKKYNRNHFEFSNRYLTRETFAMFPIDSISIRYEVTGDWNNALQGMQVFVENRTSSITTAVYPSDTAGVYHIVARTDRTPSGHYPVRITFKNKNGEFLDAVATMHVANFVEVLTMEQRSFQVADTFGEYPFRPSDHNPHMEYWVKVKSATGRPANELIFSSFGYLNRYGSVPNVRVQVDPITGELTAALQNPGDYSNYSGKGQLKSSRSDRGDHQIGGYFIYDCRSYWGYRHAGYINFK